MNFDPHEHARGVAAPADGVLRNVSGVLHQQGRVTTDADMTEGELLELSWNGQAGRDIIGAGICAVPAAEPNGFRVASALVSGTDVLVELHPGRAWADGILTRLPGELPDPAATVTRVATYFGPPLTTPQPTPDTVDDGVRDAVILEVSEQALHGFQYPQRLVEPALGGPDTSERAYVNYRIRLLRLGENDDCVSIRDRLRDDPAAKGRLTVSLAPVVAIPGDCPVAGGGGYTGFEHYLYRIEVADVPPAAPARFKWSQWNGGLVGRGRFDASTAPDRVIIDAGRAPIVHSGLTEFYLEALQYDALAGAWTVVYATMATLNTDHDLELAAPASFGTLPATTDPVFFRLWNGIADIADFTNVANPVELRDGIRLAFDAPAAGNYRPGDYWTFTVRAGDIANEQVLVDDAPPIGIVYHRVPLAEINWTGRQDTTVSGSIEDCRVPFGPLTARRGCCTFVIGDGVTSFGHFNSLEVAAAHLPAAGGELCLLPGLHRANLRLEGRRNITIHGCARRTLVLPRTQTRFDPIFHFVDCIGIRVHTLDLLTYDGIAVLADGSENGLCRDIRIDATRMIARIHCIRANAAAGLHIAHNRLHVLDTAAGLPAISLAADDSLVERNTLVLLPFVDRTPEPEEPDDDPTRDPADPCARPEVLYRFPHLVLAYANMAWTHVLALLVPLQPYRAIGGIHLRAGCERVRLLENEIVGGAGNGVTLGGDLDPPPPTPPDEPPPEDVPQVSVDIDDNATFRAVVRDESGAPRADIAVYLQGPNGTLASETGDDQGRVIVKTAPGLNLLSADPAWRIVRLGRINERVYEVVIARRAQRRPEPGFLHEITIEANRVSMMGLSGIGFGLRAGAVLAGPNVAAPGDNAKDNLLAAIDTALCNLALTPLLRATHPVRDLVILNNRLLYNLRNPFTEAMLAQAQVIGRGGVSLAVVDALIVRGNHINENGPTAADPVCGVFVGWGNDVEIVDNTLAGNGTVTAGYEDNRRAGLRGGLYIRFAGALSERLSQSTGRTPALRVHDNRVDQPAGRALTAFAFGPVSVANNHFSSAHTGRFGFLDAAFGGVLLLNFGGIHRLVARMTDNANNAGAVAEAGLPGGETLFDDNFARLDAVNRSLIACAVLVMDDLGYAGNTSSVFRGDPFFCNTVLIGDTVRATGGRLREGATRTLSMLTLALRANLTLLNQADHCIFAFPAASGPHVPRTVDEPNHVLDSTFCRDAAGTPAPVGTFAAPALSAYAAELGGTFEPDAFNATELAPLARRYMGTAVKHVATTQVALTRALQAEAVHLAAKHGAEHPRAAAVAAQARSAVQTRRLLSIAAEAVEFAPPEVPERGAAVSGRLVDGKGQGVANHAIELVTERGAAGAPLGRSDANGHFKAAFDAQETARLMKLGKLLPRVLDPAGKEVLLSQEAIAVDHGASVVVTLVLPWQQGGDPCTARTPLDRLDLDATMRQQLIKGGIEDVEDIVAIDPQVLAELLGSEDAARQLIALARRVLG
ncbi:hypothetical protein [Massilia sp. METH4]|uniref:hypothetical protein n=1 Tax=Massilia sp. METH4 TaxID=3123041 RepID=UPI0030CC0975